jgi:hypothetical protein
MVLVAVSENPSYFSYDLIKLTYAILQQILLSSVATLAPVILYVITEFLFTV